MASMFVKGKKHESLRIRLLKLNAKRAKIAMESALNSIQEEEEAEAEDNDMCQVEAIDLSLPLDSNTAQTSTDSDSSNPSSPTLSSVEQQDPPNSHEPIYDSVPSSPRPIYTNTQQVQTERELNSEQEPAGAQPNTHQWPEREELFPSQQNPCIYTANELEQSAESLPLQRMQELQALGNILFLVGQTMSNISSLYDLLLKSGVDFQRDADTRSIFSKGYSSIILNMDLANNIMYGIDFSKCFEKNK